MELAKITSKGQITLPISIRRALKLRMAIKWLSWRSTANMSLPTPPGWRSNRYRTPFRALQRQTALKQKKMLSQ